mgnify:CR=1 FL=1
MVHSATQHFCLLLKESINQPVTRIFSSHEGHVNLNGGTLPRGTVHLVEQEGQITFLPSNIIVSFISSPGAGGADNSCEVSMAS